MEIATQAVHHISDRKSTLSIDLEMHEVDHSANPIRWVAWSVPRLSSSAFIVLLIYWIFTEQNGFSSSYPSMINPVVNATANGYIGYHALGLAIWAVIAHQETIMAFAIPLFPRASYNMRKWTHILSQIIGLLCGVGGMTAILWYKNSTVNMPMSGTTFTIMDDPYYIPYSPHAWLGMTFFGSWLIQVIGRWFPERFTLQHHRFLGRVMYMAGLVCCGLGLQQQQTRQLLTTLQELAHNTTSVATATATSHWWFSQPSLGVLLLGITGITTFYYGLL